MIPARLPALLLVPAIAAALIGCPSQRAVRRSGTAPLEAAGLQFYVATNGDDANAGTLDAPWRTIQKAMSTATPGSTVSIRAGTYHELLTMNVSGSPGAPITFQPHGFVGAASCGGYTGTACAGERVILDYSTFGTMTEVRPALRIAGKRHVVVQGLVFQNYLVDGPMHVGIEVNGGSQHVEFRWNTISNFRNVHPDGPDGTTMLSVFRAGWGATSADHVTVADSAFLNCKTNMSEVITFDLGATNGLVERTWVSDTDGIALHCYRGANHLTFRANRVDWAGIKRDGTIWYPSHGPSGIGLYNDGCHDAVWERNRVAHTSYGIQSLQEPANAAQGLPQAGDAYNVTFRDNVVRDAMAAMTLGTWYSVHDGSTVHHTSVYNNTFYGCLIGFLVRPFDAATVKVRNNIVANCGTAWSNGLGWNAGTALDYNLYSGGGHGPDAHPVKADPKLANPAGDDFTLVTGSPAIDAGDPATTTVVAGETDFLGAPRFVGDRIDIGAVEAR